MKGSYCYADTAREYWDGNRVQKCSFAFFGCAEYLGDERGVMYVMQCVIICVMCYVLCVYVIKIIQ